MIRQGVLPVLILGAMSLCPAAKVRLESFAASPDSIPIGVMPFTALGEPVYSDKPWNVIADDLEFYGKFIVARGASSDSLLFEKKNVVLYIDGQYLLKGSSVTLDCSLRAIGSDDALLAKQFAGDISSLRRMAHSYADQIVEKMFGNRGIFGTRILFVKYGARVEDISFMDYDGHDQRTLVSNRSINIFPRFADSASFIFTSFITGHPNLFRGQVAGGGATRLLKDGYNEPSASVCLVTGKIAFASSRGGRLHIFTCTGDGSDVRQLTSGDGYETSPAWSPEGNQIAFTSDREGSPALYLMDAGGGNLHRLTYEGDYQDSPAWSPAGDRIAYMSRINGLFQIWTIQPDGANALQVTSNPGSNENPAWSPDGSHIAFTCRNDGQADLWAMCADGTRLKRLTGTGNAKMPDWSPFMMPQEHAEAK